MNKIENKTDAYDYLYLVHNQKLEKIEVLFKSACSFFSKKELQCLDFTPDFIINNCIKSLAKNTGVCDCCDPFTL